MTDTAIKSTSHTPIWWRIGLVIYGAFLILFGLGALLLPLMATFAASITFGGLLFVSGVIGLITLIVDWRAKGFVWRLLWAVVAIVGGLCIYFHPWEGALALTLVLGASLIAQGLIGGRPCDFAPPYQEVPLGLDGGRRRGHGDPRGPFGVDAAARGLDGSGPVPGHKPAVLWSVVDRRGFQRAVDQAIAMGTIRMTKRFEAGCPRITS